MKIEQRFENAKRSTTLKNIIATYDLGHKAVLDLGCSYGEFLANFGPGSVGITLSEEEVSYAKEHGLDVRLGNVESPLPVTEQFDAIFANNLFEHLLAPHTFLMNIKKFLKPNGILILGVPCVPKIVSLLHVRKFRGSLAIQHINFFTRDTLQLSVERAGWDVVSARGFHIMNPLIDKLLNPIYPHFYITAYPDHNFEYSDKRKKELIGYK